MSWFAAAASLAAMRPTAKIEPEACTRRHASGCTLCAEACPKAAVLITGFGARVDLDACVGCGLCVTTCPVGAISGVGQVPSAIATRLEEERALRCDVAGLLRPDDDRSFSDVPCIAGVHVEALAAGALAAGASTVVRGDCDRCPVGAGKHAKATVADARAIVAASGSAAEIVEEQVEVVEPRKGARRLRQQRFSNRATPDMSRRALFGLRRTSDEQAEPRSRIAALPPGATARQVLLAAMDQPPLPQLAASSDCTACGGCVRVCPSDALALVDGTLSHAPSACVGCMECVRVCPEGALGRALAGPEPGPRVLIHVTERDCDRCARPLGPGEAGTCHNCGARASLSDGIWAQLA